MEDFIVSKLTRTLSRDLFIDLLDMAVAKAREAHEIIRDRTQLSGRSARGAEGQIRYRIMEHGFQQVCEMHGGMALEGGLIPGTELRFFQPFMRFGGDSNGVILGLASMPARAEIPNKNMSRLSGVTLNYGLTPRLALDEKDPRPGDIFLLFLVARDPARAGEIEEVAVGIIDSKYESYVFYQPVNAFVTNYTAPVEVMKTEDSKRPENLVKLKLAPSKYVPPEAPKKEEQTETIE